MPTCITECLDNVEEAVQSQYRGDVRCVMVLSRFLISVERFIEKRGKTPVGATTIS